MSLRTLARQEVPSDLEEFDAYLARFDWFSHMSDDHRYYEAGEAASKRLSDFLKSESSTPDHKRCFNKWHSRMFNTPAFVLNGENYKTPYPEHETHN